MRISASVKITFASEEEGKKFEKLFQDAEGQLKPVSTLEIFPPLVRFGSNFNVCQTSIPQTIDMTFDIIGCEGDIKISEILHI